MIKLSDYIIRKLIEFGVTDVFMIAGGGAMHLIDSVGRSKLRYICTHHEQAAAIAAEGYARASDKMGVAIVTSGPGGTNTLTGVISQWLDSIPCLYLSGQVKQETVIASCPDLGFRQLGDQEINIVDIVRPVTKYAVMVCDPLKIHYHLEKAIYLATHGRPGPVWLDIPLDIQSSMVDEKSLFEYYENEDIISLDKNSIYLKTLQTIELLKKSERPIFLAGHGIRIAKSQDLFLEIIEKLKVPVVSSFNGFDLIPTSHPLFVGRIGTIGNRAGNFAVQNADFLLSVGSRNNIRQISYNWKVFARAAKKVIVDIDEAELKKPTVKPDIAINSDAKVFLEYLKMQVEKENIPSFEKWKDWCMYRKNLYPVVLPEYEAEKNFVNPYCFMKVLTECIDSGQVIVTGNGTASVTYFQAGIVKEKQRVIWNSGCAAMGYDLPASIGACFSIKKKPVICLAGDGSLQLNIQELQTITYHKLPIKLFVLNNQGYLSIRQTQDTFFEGRHFACDAESGVSFPDILKVASAYGLPVERIESHDKMKDKIKQILETPGPVVCEVKLLPNQKFTPRVASEKKDDGRIVSKPLEDMYPFLDREEFKSNMIIPEWKDE